MTGTTTTDEYLAEVTGERPMDVEFWDGLRQQFGPAFVRRHDRLVSAQGCGATEARVFENLWQTPAHARATLPLYAQWRSEWMEYFSGLQLGGDLIDLGCGAGVLTCAYAMLDRDRFVLGVDASDVAVNTGRALALELGLDNVEFAVGDVTSYRDNRRFATATSTAVRQMLGFRAHSHDEYPDDGPTAGLRFAQTVAEHLVPGGSYTSFERIGYDEAIAEWIGELLSAGLVPAVDTSCFLTFDDWQRMPAVHSSVGEPVMCDAEAGEAFRRAMDCPLRAA